MSMFQPTAEGEHQTSRRQLRVLLVDDDLMLLHSLRNILEQDGHVVMTAGGGQEGIDTFAAAVASGTTSKPSARARSAYSSSRLPTRTLTPESRRFSAALRPRLP